MNSVNDPKNTTMNSDSAPKAADTVQKMADSARHMGEGAMQGAQQAVDATRNAANASLDKAEAGVQKLREGVDPAISDLAAKAQELAERGINYCAQTSAQLRQQMDEYSEITTRYVRQQPGKSVLMAAAAGAVLTMLAMSMSRRR